MAKPVNDMSYYDLLNLNHYVNKEMLENKLIDFRFFKDIIDVKTSMFNYENIEDIIEPDMMEPIICFNNCLCLYKSLSLGVVLCKYVANTLDHNNLPLTYDLYSISGTLLGENVNKKDIVKVKDNKLDIPPFITLMAWIEHITKVETTLDANLTVARLPATFVGDKKLITSFNQLIKKAINGEPFAVGTSDLKGKFEQFNIDLPIDPEKLIELYKNYFNFTLQSMGIAGTNTQKRERLLVGEVQSQNEYTDFIYEELLYNRTKWVNEANKKFGTNIKLIETKRTFTRRKIDELAEQQRLSMGNLKEGDDKDDKSGSSGNIEKQ